MAQCTFDVTVTDNENPTISCPSDISQTADAGLCTAVVNYTAPIGSDNCGVASVVCSPASGSAFPVGTTTVTCTVTDDNGNTAQCTFDITVTDDENPMISCSSDISQSTDAGLCTAVVNYATPTVTDNCGVSSVVCSPPSGTVFPVGTTTVTCTVTDDNGNTAQCTFDITVTDDENPTLSCPSDISQTTDAGLCTAVVNYTAPIGSDNCGVASVTCSPASGTVFPVGTTTVTCTVTDDNGNMAQCTFDITVTDDEDPMIICPSDISQTADAGLCTAVVNYTTPTVTDNCGVSSVVCSPASGTAFPVGTTTVTCTVTDDNGNTAQCTFDIMVTDDEAPTVSCPSNISQTADAGLCTAVVDYTAPIGSDNCGVASVVCSPASGSVFPVGTTTVTCTVTDDSGNTAQCTFDITVTDDEDPTISCPSDISQTADAGLCTAVVNYTAPIGSDNCGVASVVCSPASGSVFPVGTTTVTCTVTDVNGNTAQCTFDITVTDDNNQCDPIMCNGLVTAHFDENCEVLVTVEAILLGNNGNVDDYTIMVKECGTCDPIPTSPVITSQYAGDTLVVEVCSPIPGNCCWSYIVVDDGDIPDLECEDITIDCSESSTPSTTAGAAVGFPLPPGVTIIANIDGTFTILDFDACGDVILEYSDDEDNGACPDGPLKTITRTWTATDESGNMTSCIETITVDRITGPVVFPGNVILECNNITPPDTDPSSTGYPTVNGLDIGLSLNECELQATFDDLELDGLW